MKKVAKEGEGWGWGVAGAGCSMNKRVRARGCRRIRMVEPNGGRAGRRGRGWAETRRILKTFAVLLIFFSKWVKLFYDFQRQFLATGGSLFLSPSFFPSRPFSFFHRCNARRRRHVHLARLIFSLDLSFSLTANSCSYFLSSFPRMRIPRHTETFLLDLRLSF